MKRGWGCFRLEDLKVFFSFLCSDLASGMFWTTSGKLSCSDDNRFVEDRKKDALEEIPGVRWDLEIELSIQGNLSRDYSELLHRAQNGLAKLGKV